MKKIMILGAGNAQIDAIDYCKRMGFEVHGCSYTNTDQGIPYLDHFIQLDIKDVEGIKQYVREHGIDVVYSIGSDIAMPSVMKVCEDLGLRHFVSSETARMCQSKSQMRKTLGADFVGNIPYKECASLEDALEFSAFPAMMKPTDSQGQRGCHKVTCREDIEKYFAASMDFSTAKRVILEKFIDGPEISVNAFVVKGELKFALVSDRLVFDELPGGIIREHLLPSVFTDDRSRQETIDMVERAVKKLQILDGPVYFQIKLDQNHPVILEVTPRLDGCHMWNLIHRYCGVNLLEASFTYLLEGHVELPEPRPAAQSMKLIFMCEEPNVPFDRSKYDVENSECVTWYYETGDPVKRMNGYMEKCGYRIVKC